MSTSNNPTPTYPHRCQLCKGKFRTRGGLDSHTIAKHPRTQAATDVRNKRRPIDDDDMPDGAYWAMRKEGFPI